MNKKKTAFIIGILGQDGTYLQEILLNRGYDIIGFDKNVTNKQILNKDINVLDVDLTNYKDTLSLFYRYQPTHVFNLAGVSNVFNPWHEVDEMIKSTIELPHTLIKCIIHSCPNTVFCQASSCLVFGKTKTIIQNELTPRDPIYPYGYSKNFIDCLIKGYREERNMQFCSAIFYNHDSPFRGENFFIKKLIKFAKNIKTNPDQKITFSNLNIEKDLGYAKDYMEAFVLMGEAKVKDDYIVSSGKLTKLIDIVSIVSELAKINLFDHLNIEVNTPKHDNCILFGDNSKIKKELNWSPSIKYEEVVKEIWNSSL